MNYLLGMAKNKWKKVLWVNIQSRMNTLYGKENLTRLIKEAHVGPGTVTRIKEQETSVGVDVIEKVATALKVEPWQLMHPTLGETFESNQPLALIDKAQAATNNIAIDVALKVLSAALEQANPALRDALAGMLSSLAKTPAQPELLEALTKMLSHAAFVQDQKKVA